MLTEGDITRIATRIATGYAPLVVGTFGSYALGTPKPTSDLDVFVIKDTRESPAARRNAVMRLLFGVLHKVDVHVFTPAEFESTVDERLSFAWVIVRQARIYCWHDKAGCATPSLARSRAPISAMKD
ncbi:MAG TPA: nucleotidyltransferase domain-containing protein [Kofleriaceae bacterium]|jgi:predicted nucleotidyltransferase